jgi:adiponectin receptor
MSHVPERFIADWKLAHWLDSIGGGSHAIWHAFIVLAISQHKAAIGHMRNGIGCEVS